MEQFLLWSGRLVGAGGVLLTGLAVVVRINSTFALFGFQIGTLLLVGVAATAVGCFCLLMVLTSRR